VHDTVTSVHHNLNKSPPLATPCATTPHSSCRCCHRLLLLLLVVATPFCVPLSAPTAALYIPTYNTCLCCTICTHTAPLPAPTAAASVLQVSLCCFLCALRQPLLQQPAPPPKPFACPTPTPGELFPTIKSMSAASLKPTQAVQLTQLASSRVTCLAGKQRSC
jgi:hypothetical protein